MIRALRLGPAVAGDVGAQHRGDFVLAVARLAQYLDAVLAEAWGMALDGARRFREADRPVGLQPPAFRRMLDPPEETGRLAVRVVRQVRSEERRVGKGWVRTCSSGWQAYHEKKKSDDTGT